MPHNTLSEDDAYHLALAGYAQITTDRDGDTSRGEEQFRAPTYEELMQAALGDLALSPVKPRESLVA